MKNILKISVMSVICTLGLMGGSAFATPSENSCKLLAAIGQNNVTMVSETLENTTGHWSEANRTGIQSNLKDLVEKLKFAGGNVYQIAKIGDDLEEHLLLLRLEKGEVAGMRLRYEWSPKEMLLVTIKFERFFNKYSVDQFLQAPVKIECP